MKPMDIEDIASAVGAVTFKGSGSVSAVCTDTRMLTQGCLFIALKGDSFDGHEYINKALENGALFAISQQSGDYPTGKVLLVENTRAALLAVAGLHRNRMNAKVVAVTGSVGKTTTKEMVAAALSAQFLTLKNEANLNNEIGLSHTMLKITEEHRAAVLEMGMDGPGQIHPMSMSAQPDIAIVTNIGLSHLEAMGSKENTLKEKLSVADGMQDGAPLILCGDDPMLRDYRQPRLDILYYGIDNTACDVLAVDIDEQTAYTTMKIRYGGRLFDCNIPTIGRHNIYNALAAFCVAVCLNISPEKAVKALEDYVPAGMRQKIVEKNGYTVVEDCYNASPDSMKAALGTLAEMKCNGRKIAVLSDMLELGSVEQSSHYDVGKLVAQLDIDILACSGSRSKQYAQGAEDGGMKDIHYFEDQAQLQNWLGGNIRTGDILWFKASRGMKLEQTIEKIYEIIEA